jgi:hypothetical protein
MHLQDYSLKSPEAGARPSGISSRFLEKDSNFR